VACGGSHTQFTIHLIGQRVHDDRVGYDTERMDFAHQNVGGYFVEVNVLQEVADDLLQVYVLWKKGLGTNVMRQRRGLHRT
jgi:hypothetical protein